MIELLIFLIVLGVLVLVHEFGHFIMAKRAGMRVDEFGFGFPPRIYGWKFGETLYSINLIPFGGFVKIYGEDGADKDNPRSFSGQSAWRKTKVISAGVIMNVFLAFVLLFFGNIIGLRTAVSEDTRSFAHDIKIHIFQIAPDSPASEAGIQLLDEIIGISSVDSTIVPSAVEDIQEFVDANKGRNITLLLRRAGESTEIKLVPRESPPEGQGPIGIALEATGVISYPWHEALWRSALMTYSLIIAVVLGMVEFFRLLLVETRLSPDVAGPIGIYFLTKQFVYLGFGTLLAFVAQISVALAVLNSLPLVPLDGGRQLLIVIEKFKGRAISIKTQNIMALVGWILLVTLIIFVTKQDIARFF